MYVNKEIIDENTLNIFRACIGNRIGRVALESVDSRAHPVISKIFEIFKFDTLEVIARPLSQNDVYVFYAQLRYFFISQRLLAPTHRTAQNR